MKFFKNNPIKTVYNITNCIPVYIYTGNFIGKTNDGETNRKKSHHIRNIKNSGRQNIIFYLICEYFSLKTFFQINLSIFKKNIYNIRLEMCTMNVLNIKLHSLCHKSISGTHYFNAYITFFVYTNFALSCVSVFRNKSYLNLINKYVG